MKPNLSSINTRQDQGGFGAAVPPNSRAAEQAVLGGIMLENSAINSVLEILGPEDFYVEANAQAFRSMSELFSRGQPVDIVTLRDELARRNKLEAVGGDEYILSLTHTIPAVANIASHAKIIREKAVVRRLIIACHEIAAQAYDDYGDFEQFLDLAEKSVFDVAKERVRHPYEHIKDVVLRTFRAINEAAERKQRITGLPTGFDQLDRMTAGFQPGDLVIIAGRPGMGKTAFAVNIGINACVTRNVPIAIFSLEMPKEQIMRRMLCSEARVSGTRLRSGMLSREDWPKLASAAGVLSELPVWIDDTPGLSIMELRAKTRRLKAETGLGLIVVDYMQLMRAGFRVDSREQEISEISRSMKNLAKELSIPVIALSQLNRAVENRAGKDKRPQLADLRESGAIEQDADTILFIYRDEVYQRDDANNKGVAEIIVGKQRSGPTGTLKCRFFSEYTRFDNLADEGFDEFA